MIVYRLSKSKYCRDLSGKGAETSGGRWNSKGVAMLYTSASRALATTEIAVHTSLGLVPTDYVMVTIEIPDGVSEESVNEPGLSPDWRSFPHPHFTQEIGDQFVKENNFLVLKVPSAIVQGDFNYLINPKHPEFSTVNILKTESFSFDERLFVR